jgi:hypothetical protein
MFKKVLFVLVLVSLALGLVGCADIKAGTALVLKTNACLDIESTGRTCDLTLTKGSLVTFTGETQSGKDYFQVEVKTSTGKTGWLNAAVLDLAK